MLNYLLILALLVGSGYVIWVCPLE
jgi:hypothetical protein